MNGKDVGLLFDKSLTAATSDDLRLAEVFPKRVFPVQKGRCDPYSIGREELLFGFRRNHGHWVRPPRTMPTFLILSYESNAVK
jgi:hypothetical protein